MHQKHNVVLSTTRCRKEKLWKSTKHIRVPTIIKTLPRNDEKCLLGPLGSLLHVREHTVPYAIQTTNNKTVVADFHRSKTITETQ